MLVGTYLRNLLLNWCVIIPLLAAFLALAFDTLDHCASRDARWSIVTMQQ